MPLAITWKGEQVVSNVRRAAEVATNETTDAAVRTARINAPVRTGAYRDSLRSTPARSQGDVVRGSWGSDISYAIYIEVGARGQPGRHVLRRAGDMELPEHWKRIKARL